MHWPRQTSAGGPIGITLNVMLLELARGPARSTGGASEHLMLRITRLQSGRTPALINDAGQSDPDEGGISELIDFAATVIAPTTTRVTASPMPAEPDSIPCRC